MPVLAGWLTGEQVPQQVIEAVLTTMGTVLGKQGGEASRIVQSGMGLISYTNVLHASNASQQLNEPSLLDWTPDRRTFIYRRPLSGLHGLYYVENWPSPGNLLFATEIQALLAVGVPRKLHLPALAALLRYGCIPSPWTAFKDISLVPVGSILRWQRGKTILNPSTDFHLESASTTSITPDDVQEELDVVLQEAIKALLPTQSQPALLTDGTAPSLLTAALALQLTSKPTNTSITSRTRLFRGTRSRRSQETPTLIYYDYEKRDEERNSIEQVATHYQCPLLTVEGVDHPDFLSGTLASVQSPFVDSRPIALHQLLHTCKHTQKTQVALTAVGASTLAMHHLPLPVNLFQQKQFLPPIFTHDARQRIQNEETWEDTLYARKLIRHAQQLNDEMLQRHYLNLHIWLPDYLVHPLQQIAKQEGIAVYSPFLTRKLIEFFTHIPVEPTHESPKYTLLTHLANRYLPGIRIVEESSSLLIPMKSLLTEIQEDAPEILRQAISVEALQATGIFEVEEVMKLRQQQEVSRELMLVFTTQLLYKMFEMSM